MILSKHRLDGWRHLQLMQRAMLACHVPLCWWRGTSRMGASGGRQLLHGLKRWHEVTGHANWLSPSYAAVPLHHLQACSLPCNCCHFGSNRVLCLTMQTVLNNCRSISCGAVRRTWVSHGGALTCHAVCECVALLSVCQDRHLTVQTTWQPQQRTPPDAAAT